MFLLFKEFCLIQVFDPTAKNDLQRLQKSNWRALPSLIQSSDEIAFKNRAKVAADIVTRISKLKSAPYYHNWKLLCNFTHWSALHYKYINEEIAEQLYLRTFNISLGFAHDMINACFDYMHLYFPNIEIPESLRAIRLQFHWFKT